MSTNLKDIDRRINDLWSRGRYADAGEIIAKDLLPIVVDHLVVSRRLSREDAEDAVGSAHHAFLKKVSEKGPLSVTAPKPYLWRASETQAIDCKKRAKKVAIPISQIPCAADMEEVSAHESLDFHFQNGAMRGLVPSWQMRATFLVEGLIDEIEITQSDAVTIVQNTLTRLSRANSEIINHVLQYGPDQPAVDAARILKINTANNFGVRKCRAYKEFREMAPRIASELGIQWRGVTEEEVAAEVAEIIEFMPSDDELAENENSVL